MNTAQNTASVVVSAAGSLSNSGTLVLLSGTMPATPETALAGNTTLATATYSATAFGAPTFIGADMQATASFTANINPVANGSCTFARHYKSDGTTVIADYRVGSAWIASNVTAVGQYCTNGGNTYKCTTAGTTAASGGPTGTAAGIVDGTVTWNYVGSVSDTWVASTVYAANVAVAKGGNWYIAAIGGTSAASGGPSGKGNDIVDGTVHWNYVGPVGFFDLTMGNCNVQVGTAVTVTQTLEAAAA
jgi:hypothetical protein